MKMFIAAVAIAVSLAVAAPAISYRNADISRSIVALKDSEDNIICTGVVINRLKRYVLTADHCMSHGDVLIDGQISSEIAHLPELDYAIIEAPGIDRPALEFQFDTKVAAEQAVEAIGYAEGFEELTYIKLTLIFGPIIVVDYAGEWLLMGPYVIPGMSGGPVVTPKGLVVAINQQSTKEFGLSITRPITMLKGTILEEYFEGRPAYEPNQVSDLD